MFLYPLGNDHNLIWCLQEEGGLTQRKTHIQLQNALLQNNGSHWVQTVANARKTSNLRRESKIYLLFEALCAIENVWHKMQELQWVSSGHVVFRNSKYPYFCVANIMKIGTILFWSLRIHYRSVCIWAPVKIIYIWVVVIVMVIAFGGRGYRFHSCSFHWCSFPFMLLSYSFHLHSNVHSCPFVFLSFHFAFMSFHFLSKVMEMALWLGQGIECDKWLSLSYRYIRLSPNNPSNIWHCSKEICHKTTERERERASKRERGRERKRASELDAKC